MRRALLMRLGAVWLAVGCLGCWSPSEPSVGGESHWLAECSHDEECGSDLSCVCGTCTRACSMDQACAGSRDAACYDPSSPLLLKRCEDRSIDESQGVCLPHCLKAKDCGEKRTCMQGACVPLTKTDVPDSSDAGIQVGETNADVPWSEPIQVPALAVSIEGGDDSIVGDWRQSGCVEEANDSAGCLRLVIERNADGALTGSVSHVNHAATGSLAGPGPLAPANDPDVGYPIELDPMQYADVLYNPPFDLPYRMLDGRLASGHLTFQWTSFDLWHDWCRMQTPYPWQVGDRRFYFCVPQDEETRASYDRGKIALCTSADFLKLCTDQNGQTVPCVCAEHPRDPADSSYPDTHYDQALCTPAYCQCDAQGCDINTAFLFSESLEIQGDQLVGVWDDSFNSIRSVPFERSAP